MLLSWAWAWMVKTQWLILFSFFSFFVSSFSCLLFLWLFLFSFYFPDSFFLFLVSSSLFIRCLSSSLLLAVSSYVLFSLERGGKRRLTAATVVTAAKFDDGARLGSTGRQQQRLNGAMSRLGLISVLWIWRITVMGGSCGWWLRGTEEAMGDWWWGWIGGLAGLMAHSDEWWWFEIWSGCPWWIDEEQLTVEIMMWLWLWWGLSRNSERDETWEFERDWDLRDG